MTHALTFLKKKTSLAALVTLILAFSVYFLLPDTFSEAAKRTAAIFVFAVGFWAFEIVPLYATSIILIILLTFFLGRPGGVLDFDKMGYTHFLVPFSSPVIMLFLGGFFLAAAVRKHSVFEFLMQKMLTHLGNRSWVLLLSYLFMSALFSMWISNTAATAMMLTLITPILKHLEKDDPLRKGLVLAIPIGANLGGMGTPVGTPPNAIAIGMLAERDISLDFLSWLVMAVPIAVILLTVAFFWLLWLFPPKHHRIDISIKQKIKLTKNGVYVICIVLTVILLWLTTPFHKIPEAMISLLAVGILAATKLLHLEDLKSIDWDILLLMWGGLALGAGVEISGLIDHFLKFPLFAQHGTLLILVFSLLAVLLSSFISNTATANMLIPIAASFSGDERIILSIAIALSCSFALAFPISTPPNAMAYGTGIFTTKDMFKSGAVISVIAIVLLIVGYKVMIPFVFHVIP